MGNSMPGPLLEICLPKDDELPAEAPTAPPLPRPARLDDQAARADFEQKFANGLRLIKFGRNGASQRRVFSLVLVILLLFSVVPFWSSTDDNLLVIGC